MREEDKFIEENRMTTFKGEIPISINNFSIFNKVFISEQWIRRIIMFVLMRDYGKDWIKAFNDKDLEDYENMRRKLVGKEIIDLKDDNLLWYASLAYLGKFIKRNDIKTKIENITGVNAKKISSSIFKIADIRNEMAHNRTITKFMEIESEKSFNILKQAISNFKENTIYDQKSKIKSNFFYERGESRLETYFNMQLEKQYKKNNIQAFLAEADDFYSIVLLPCKALSDSYINICKLLEIYTEFKDYIIAFFVNKSGNEYQIILSKKSANDFMVNKEIINIFFEIVGKIGTNLTYELQDSKFTCNPKIWFYENSTEDVLKSELW